MDAFAAGRAFLEREGRLIERRLAAALFDGGPVGAVVDTLRGYRNADGGFGHGLEPDKRCPDSLPIDVEGALEILIVAGADEERLVLDACESPATSSSGWTSREPTSSTAPSPATRTPA